MEVRPFRALRYDPSAAGEMSALVAPPYDVIDDAQRDSLYARNPHNVVRLILGREADRYASAAQHFAEWQRSGILVRDREPTLSIYTQEFGLPNGERRVRSGLIGAIRLEPFSSGHVRPHERTLAEHKADRMRLIEATQANLSPIFGLYRDGRGVLEPLFDGVDRGRPLVDVTDDGSVRHRLWRVADATRIEAAAASLAPQTIYIADGHHRYETALAYRDRLASKSPLHADAPANFIMMYLCAMTDPGLVILPTHRVLSGTPDFSGPKFVGQVRRYFTLRALPSTSEGRASLLRELRAVGEPGHLGIAVRGDTNLYLASLADAGTMDREAADCAPPLRRLDVTILDRLVLRGIFGVEAAAAAHAGRLRYVKDDLEALEAVDRGADVALLLNATRMEEVIAACEAGETMPEKSTYFYPKLLSGLTFHLLRPDS